MYVGDLQGIIHAIGLKDGLPKWKLDLGSDPAVKSPGMVYGGVTVHGDRVFVTARSFLWALDRRTGQPIASFGREGRLDLREGLGKAAERLSVSASTPGSVFDDLIILGSSKPFDAKRSFDDVAARLRASPADVRGGVPELEGVALGHVAAEAVRFRASKSDICAGAGRVVDISERAGRKRNGVRSS